MRFKPSVSKLFRYMKLTLKVLEQMIEDEIDNLVLDATNKPREIKYDCKITDVDIEKGFEKDKDLFGKTKEYPIVKTTRIQKCKLKLAQ